MEAPVGPGAVNGAGNPPGDRDAKGPSPGKSSSRTITDTIVGELHAKITAQALIYRILGFLVLPCFQYASLCTPNVASPFTFPYRR